MVANKPFVIRIIPGWLAAAVLASAPGCTVDDMDVLDDDPEVFRDTFAEAAQTKQPLEPLPLEPVPVPVPDPVPVPASHDLPCGDPNVAPPVDELCPPQRQIAQIGPDCPLPDPNSEWTLEVMFAGLGIKTSLPNYCRYLWTDPNLEPDLATLPLAVQGQSAPDCRVLPQSPLESALGPSFDQAFAQGLEPVAAPATALQRPGTPVHVAVVDTAPSKATDGKAAHGPAIAAIIANVADGCVPMLSDNGECRRQVETVLGLPQVGDEGPDYLHGGYYGYQSDLAEGIAAAIDGWDNHDDKFIVNLSVGWEPSLGDLDVDGVSSLPAVNAVRDAVGLAVCSGALVIAATGNQPQGTCADAATGPGSWEAVAGYDVNACLALGMSLNDIDIDASQPFHPLLHAATPLDWSLENLESYRPDSGARIATVGYGGVGTVAGVRRGPLSGSSVSAASLSGIAALVWSFYPQLSADELMALIYQSAAPRMAGNHPVPASLHGPQSPWDQHLASACAALSLACDQLESVPGRCGALPLCQGPSVDVNAWWADFSAGFNQLAPSEVDGGPAPALVEYDCESCGMTRASKLPEFVSLRAEDMPNPWVLPQPEDPPCPMCGIQDDDGFLTLDPAYSGMALRNVAITLFDAVGNREQLYYGTLPVDASTVYVLNDPDLQLLDRSATVPVAAWIDMVFLDPTGAVITAGNPIPVQ